MPLTFKKLKYMNAAALALTPEISFEAAVLPKAPELITQISTEVLAQGLKNTKSLSVALRSFFQTHSAEDIGYFKRSELGLPNGRDYYMPARIGKYDAVKWISSRPENTANGMDRSQSIIIIKNAATGLPEYLVPSSPITHFKTAVLTFLALEEWAGANKIENLSIGLLGGGPVAKQHLTSAYELFGDRIKEVKVYSPRESGRKLVRDLSETSPCIFAEREELFATSNVIISCTDQKKPVLEFTEIPKCTRPIFVAGVGFYDIGVDFFEKASLIVSEDPIAYRASTFPLAKYLNIPETQVLGSLSEVVQGKRSLASPEMTLFMPYGTAMVDLAVCIDALGLAA